jgi:hypothetical protein
MALKQLTPMLWPDNFDETIDFYVGIWGFTCVIRNDGWGWASLRNGADPDHACQT